MRIQTARIQTQLRQLGEYKAAKSLGQQEELNLGPVRDLLAYFTFETTIEGHSFWWKRHERLQDWHELRDCKAMWE